MPKWLCKISVDIQRHEPVMTPEGPRPMIAQQITHLCLGESHGDTPSHAVDQALDETKAFLARLG